MSRDHIINLYTRPDLDESTIGFSHHRTKIKPTGEVQEDPYPSPLGRQRELFEKVEVTLRGPVGTRPLFLWRRIR